MLIDCFTFYNEINMLRFRLEELKDVVDYFVLVESDMTFNKNRKHFIENSIFIIIHKKIFILNRLKYNKSSS
jgi:hypothetical protein